MREVLDYVPAKDGLTALDKFVAGKIVNLPPFSLPVRYKIPTGKNYCIFDYYQGIQTGVQTYFHFILSREQTLRLGETLYVVPHSETTRGLNPYYWLTLHPAPEDNSPRLTSCRLRPEEEKHKIKFQGWHGLEEQLLADYILRINNLRFGNLLPFSLVDINKNNLKAYLIAGVTGLAIQIGENSTIQNGDTLRFIPRTDDQQLYEWFDILKHTHPLPEERWPLVCSYRLLSAEHRIYSSGWFGPERQLLIDRIQDRAEIKFENLRPIRATASSNGKEVNFFRLSSRNVKGTIYLRTGLLSPEEETVSKPRRDEQSLYEWLELYRVEPLTSSTTGEMLTSARITPEGLTQQDWLGVERQLLRDYVDGLVLFKNLKPITLVIGEGKDMIHLWKDGEKKVYLVLSKSFDLHPGDKLSFMPENEIDNGAIFLLAKNSQIFGRYKLDRNSGQFTCIENVVINQGISLNYDPQTDTYTDNKGKNWITRTGLAKKIGIAYTRLDPLLGGVATIQYKRAERTTTFELFSEAEVLEKAAQNNINSLDCWSRTEFDFLPGIRMLTFRDSQGNWLIRDNIQSILRSVDKNELDQFLQGITMKQVRASSGRIVTVYNLNECLNLQQVQYLQLPVTDKETGLYTDDQGEWAAAHHIARKYEIPHSTLNFKGFLDLVSKRRGISGGHTTFLYNIAELNKLHEFQEYLKRRREKSKNRESDTAIQRKFSWKTLSDEEKIDLIEREARKILEAGLELNRKKLSANFRWLVYGIQSFYPGELVGLQLRLGVPVDARRAKKVKAEKASIIEPISSDEANEQLLGLLREVEE